MRSISTLVDPAGTGWPGSFQPQVNTIRFGGITSMNSPCMTSSVFGSTLKIPPGRASISALNPIQRIYLSACVRYRKISSGAAAMKISLTIGFSASTSCSLVLFDLSLKRGQAALPENLEEGAHIAERFFSDAVKALGSLAAQLKQAGIGQKLKMLRDRLPCGLEMRGDLSRRTLLLMD